MRFKRKPRSGLTFMGANLFCVPTSFIDPRGSPAVSGSGQPLFEWTSDIPRSCDFTISAQAAKPPLVRDALDVSR